MAVKFKFAMKNMLKEQWEKDHGKNWKEKKKSSTVVSSGVRTHDHWVESLSANRLDKETPCG